MLDTPHYSEPGAAGKQTRMAQPSRSAGRDRVEPMLEEIEPMPSSWANSGPLCLIAFAAVTFMFSLVNAEGVSPAVVPVIISTGLTISAVLEGASFLRSVGQAHPEADALERDLVEHVVATSDPTLRAVFAEDVLSLSAPDEPSLIV